MSSSCQLSANFGDSLYLQAVSINDMAKRPGTVLEMVSQGPVALMFKSKPAAIMIDPAEWNATTYEVEMLRHLTLCDWVALEVRRDPNLVKIIKTKEEWISLLDE